MSHDNDQHGHHNGHGPSPSEKCALVRTTREKSALRTEEGCFYFNRTVQTFWCTPRAAKNEPYARKVFSTWTPTGEQVKGEIGRWVPEGPRYSAQLRALMPEPEPLAVTVKSGMVKPPAPAPAATTKPAATSA